MITRNAGPADRKREDAEVTPSEDLMQEHEILERLFLVYDEGARRIEHSEPLASSSPGALCDLGRHTAMTLGPAPGRHARC